MAQKDLRGFSNPVPKLWNSPVDAWQSGAEQSLCGVKIISCDREDRDFSVAYICGRLAKRPRSDTEELKNDRKNSGNFTFGRC